LAVSSTINQYASWVWRRIGMTILPAAGVGLLISALLLPALYALNYHSIGYRNSDIVASVRAGFASGELQDKARLEGDTGRGIHQYNDCLILYQAIDQSAPRSTLAVSPLNNTAKPGPCQNLRALVNGHALPDPTRYHNYLHGHTMVARYALAHISVSALRTIYKSLETLILAIGIGLALIQLAIGRGDRFDHLFWLVIFSTFARWFGLEAFGQSLSHGPADTIFLGFLLILYITRNLGGLPGWLVAPLAALFGIGTIVFEFLTGGIPLGWAALIGALPFAFATDTPPERIVRAVLGGLTAYSTAVAASLIGKFWLVYHSFGMTALHNITGALAIRISIAEGDEPANKSLAGLIEAIWQGSGTLAVGMHWLSGLAILTAFACGAWGTRLLLRADSPTTRVRAMLLAGSNGALLIWIALFSQHFIVHYFFMGRIFAWTLASGFALFALAIWWRNTAARLVSCSTSSSAR
jgi:hypothetical protein